MQLDEIRLGDTVRLRNGEFIRVAHKMLAYHDAAGDHPGPFVGTRSLDRFLLADVVEVVQRNERVCRYCGEGVTATNPDTDFCSGCFYSGRSQQERFAGLIAELDAVSNGRTWSVWHTGGGCFCLGTTVSDTDPREVMASADSQLPDTPDGPWMFGVYDESGDEFYPAENLTRTRLVAHVLDVMSHLRPDGVKA